MSENDSRKINIVGEMSWTEPDFSPEWKRPNKLALTPQTTFPVAFISNHTFIITAPPKRTPKRRNNICRVPCKEFG